MTHGDVMVIEGHVTPRSEAEAAQRAASDPAVSAFVAASAGSGKTRLLTDRLLRLMVGGAKPERILCLTFTKAAAAEMSLRLQRRLGEWVTLEQSALETRLRDLAVEPTESAVNRARSLFALVLDLPGGMRIGTIHAFCQSLLRRFPLEAMLSPHFQLADDRDANEAMTEAQEALLSSVRSRGLSSAPSELEISLRSLAGITSLAGFGKLVKTLKFSPGRWREARALDQDLAVARRRILGVSAPDRASVIAAAVRCPEEDALREAARVIAVKGSEVVKLRSEAILRWLSLSPERRAEQWDVWRGLFLKDTGEIRNELHLVNKVLDRADPTLLPPLVREAARVLSLEQEACATDVAAVSEALLTLARPLLELYEGRKNETALLEFDDLVERGAALLVDPGADWVLYKLDGGLEHLLLDEVQDTAPEQWDIAHGLTNEFFAGIGASESVRTVFAVGDRKQSIFSFQGADVSGFENAHHALKERVLLAGLAWVDRGLHVSFRSTAPILELVDAIFADPLAAAGVTLAGEVLSHRADRAGHAGSVELWPLVETPPLEAPRAWAAPEGYQSTISAVQKLANDLAVWIRQQTSGTVMLESRGRPLRPGDIMILVRRRDALPTALVRAMKSLGVPVAGLDRMVLTQQPAVSDLMALADALLLPEDDLTFASFLTSPLGGLNDDDLMALAIGRARPLWMVLRDRHREAAAWTIAWLFFSALLARVDYVTPHVLFAEALGALGGRQKLLARLGAEAAEPIDELLNTALSYTKKHPPSLQGFLQWLRRSGAEIKREAEAAGNHVRILTVHGAKGLQAPLVILPDTTAMPNDEDNLLWADDPLTGRSVPIWVPRKEFHCEGTLRIRGIARQARREEHNRLLYVALTRAEDRLLICGASPKRGAIPDQCWYNLIVRGLARLTDVPNGAVVRYQSPQLVPPAPESIVSPGSETSPPPAFLYSPPKPEPVRPMPLAPSRPEGVELGRTPASASPLSRVLDGMDRFKRGSLIHGLLQHLPAVADSEWHMAASRFLSGAAGELTGGTLRAIADEAIAILRHPKTAPLFGPGSLAEVPLTGVVRNVVVGGLIDRLLVLPDVVMVADYKTNRSPPATVEATPVTYLRQMASYRAVLRGIFPGRGIECLLIWTHEATVTVLPATLLDRYEPGRD